MALNGDNGSTNNQVPVGNDDENKRKRIGFIIGAILLVLALIAGLWFFVFNKDKDEEPVTPETTTSSSPAPTNAEKGSGEDTPEKPQMTTSGSTENTAPKTEEKLPYDTNRPPEQRVQPEPPTPLPTTPTRKEQLMNSPFDVGSGSPESIAEMNVMNMFMIKPQTGKGYKEQFNEGMKGRMSRQMETVGFKKWWRDDEPEHTMFFQSLMNSGDSQVYAFPELQSEKRIANDMMVYEYVVKQKIKNDVGTTNIADFRIAMVMVGNEKGEWLLNDYYFPYGSVPIMH